MYGVDTKPLSAAYLELSIREGYDSVLDWVNGIGTHGRYDQRRSGDNLTQARANMKIHRQRKCLTFQAI